MMMRNCGLLMIVLINHVEQVVSTTCKCYVWKHEQQETSSDAKKVLSDSNRQFYDVNCAEVNTTGWEHFEFESKVQFSFDIKIDMLLGLCPNGLPPGAITSPPTTTTTTTVAPPPANTPANAPSSSTHRRCICFQDFLPLSQLRRGRPRAGSTRQRTYLFYPCESSSDAHQYCSTDLVRSNRRQTREHDDDVEFEDVDLGKDHYEVFGTCHCQAGLEPEEDYDCCGVLVSSNNATHDRRLGLNNIERCSPSGEQICGGRWVPHAWGCQNREPKTWTYIRSGCRCDPNVSACIIERRNLTINENMWTPCLPVYPGECASDRSIYY